MTAQEAFLLAIAYTDKAIEGGGALKGAPCQIQSITPITGGNRITFAWENSEGETETDTLDVMDGVNGTNGTDGTDGTDGVGISSITFKEKDVSGNNVYTVTLTNTNTYDITCPIGPQGETGATGATGATGNGIASITKTGTSGLVDTYTITYTNGATSTFTVTNGQDGNSNEFIGTLAEWNAKTTAQKKEYDTYQITDDYSQALMPNYSTVEQKTGQKWVDGRDIYVKTFNAGALPSSGNVTVQNDIANFGAVINVETTGISNDGYSFSNDGLVMNYASASSFVFRVTFDATGYNGYVTVYYVKTA